MNKTSIEDVFSQLEDPRREHGQLHKLIDIITIAVCAVISGAETWVDIVDFGCDKEDWLQGFLALPNGIPSHDTFARVFQLLDPQQLQACFQEWVHQITSRVEGDVVAIDGKTLRGSHDRWCGKAAVHLLHAWSVEAGLILAQQVVDDKTNEITVIPDLLEILYLKGCIVTLDAMGCQTEIVEAIVDQHEADYVIALKENQKALYQHLQEIFAYADRHHPRLIGAYDRTQHIGKPRGVVERRICEVFYDTDGLRLFREQHNWAGLKSIARVQYAKKQGDEWVTTQTRYFISSLDAPAAQILRTIRSHWHIENKLHRVLDVTFRQDDARIRVGHSPENFAVIQHIALNLLKKHPKKISIRRKRLQSARSDNLRWQILTAIS